MSKRLNYLVKGRKKGKRTMTGFRVTQKTLRKSGRPRVSTFSVRCSLEDLGWVGKLDNTEMRQLNERANDVRDEEFVLT